MSSLVIPDFEIDSVAAALKAEDPTGSQTAQVLRDTIDQLYDGQRTGRYRWDQLFKTEKTHCGTLVEINLQRKFKSIFKDGVTLDFQIAGVEVDCKYSQTMNGWMIPPEARGHVCLLLSAEDTSDPKWSMGLVRAIPENLNSGTNRDGKATLNEIGRKSIAWLLRDAPLTPNILLQLDRKTVENILAQKSGQKRINELFRNSLGKIVGRGVIATVAQQDDYMKRVRENGGARTALKSEGIIILGQFTSHTTIATALQIPVPGDGELISVRIVRSKKSDVKIAQIDGQFWKVAGANDPMETAPTLPKIIRATKS